VTCIFAFCFVSDSPSSEQVLQRDLRAARSERPRKASLRNESTEIRAANARFGGRQLAVDEVKKVEVLNLSFFSFYIVVSHNYFLNRFSKCKENLLK